MEAGFRKSQVMTIEFAAYNCISAVPKIENMTQQRDCFCYMVRFIPRRLLIMLSLHPARDAKRSLDC